MARKILLADDSVTAQNMGRKILADAGYDVVTVNNGSAALKRITEIKPDLIVLDVYMPGYSGLEVCQRLKDASETAHIPVLLTVGKLEPFKADEARRVRADAHIVKPFEASELLTAIMRLEDRVVPQQSEGARFSGEGGGWRTEGDTDPDTGWKSRLRFPSKKKKEEPDAESDEIAAGATFRDFRKGKSKNGASTAVVVKTPTPVAEPVVVPDIPRDITPEELDALSALAEKLDGRAAAAAEVLATKADAVPTEVGIPAAAADAKTAVETPAPVVEVAAAPVEVAAPMVEAPAFEEKNEVQIPVGQVESTVESVAAPDGLATIEAQPRETDGPQTQQAETIAAAVPATVNAALLTQQAAPVDRNDEPLFASAANEVGPSAETKTEQKIEAAAVEIVGQTGSTETPVAIAHEEAAASKELESKAEELQTHASGAEASAPEKIEAVPVAVSMPEPEGAGPSDEELAEALRLLTPATGHAEVATVPTRGTLVAAGQLLAEEAARNAASGPRWVAEPMELSPEEAAKSLEAEMFGTFAAVPAAISAAASRREFETAGITGVSAIAAAVENRLAAVDRAASAKGLVEREFEVGSVAATTDMREEGSSGSGLETTTSEPLAVEAPAEGAVSNPASGLVDMTVSPEVAPEIAPEQRDAEQHGAEQRDSASRFADQTPVEEEVAAATFADAVGVGQTEYEAGGTPAVMATAASAEQSQDSSPEIGGQESMGKDGKSKTGTSNWHQIHAASASVAASSDVETAKQAGAEEAPKAMAAAASAEAGTASSSVPDASTIASIVDSVMADLRPRIVEEIARKLAGK